MSGRPLVALLLAGPVAAQGLKELPRVYLVRLKPIGQAVSPLVPQRLDKQLRAELTKAADIRLGPDLPLDLAGPAAADPADRLTQAREHQARARAHIGKQEYSQALEEQKLAVQGLEQDLAHLERFGELIEAELLQGVIHVLLEQMEDGDGIFQRVVTRAPEYQPDLSQHPEVVGDVFASARRRVLKRKRATLQVATEPAAADVFVDGRPVGKAPAKVKDLLPGAHWVVARGDGGAVKAERVEVTVEEPARVQVALAAAEPKPAGGAMAATYHAEIAKRLGQGQVDRRIKKVAGAFSDAVAADYLALGNVSREGKGYVVRAYVFRKDGSLLAEADAAKLDAELASLDLAVNGMAHQIVRYIHSFPEDRDINVVAADEPAPDEAAAAARTAGLVQLDQEDADVSQVDPAPPIWRRWWFLTAVGAVVVGGAAAGGFLLLSGGGDDGYDLEASWQR